MKITPSTSSTRTRFPLCTCALGFDGAERAKLAGLPELLQAGSSTSRGLWMQRSGKKRNMGGGGRRGKKVPREVMMAVWRRVKKMEFGCRRRRRHFSVALHSAVGGLFLSVFFVVVIDRVFGRDAHQFLAARTKEVSFWSQSSGSFRLSGPIFQRVRMSSRSFRHEVEAQLGGSQTPSRRA